MSKKPCFTSAAVVDSPPVVRLDSSTRVSNLAKGEFIFFRKNTMAYAVIKTGGKQYRVAAGDQIDVEKLNLEVDSETTFDEVLMVNDGSSIRIGSPVVDGVTVSAKVLNQFRGPKGVAFKFKRRKGFHKTKGFRRHMTKLEITGING